MDTLILYSKLNSLPENLKSEVLNFIESIVLKSKKEKPNLKPKFGAAKGDLKIKDGFNDSIEDFSNYIK